METALVIEDLTCPRCGERVEAALKQVPGVIMLKVDWQNGQAYVIQGAEVSGTNLVRAVEDAARGTRHRYRARVQTEAGTN